MALVVQKYGGSSVSDVDAMRRVARRIVATRQAGNTVVVVVSAMGDTTDELLDQAAALTTAPPAREMDILLSAGERISMALLAMVVTELGVPARRWRILAPWAASSRVSSLERDSMRLAVGTMRGSAVNRPSTSV